MESSSFQRFPRLSPILLLLITFGTLGLYVPYWLYTRTRLLNTLCSTRPVPSLIIALCMGSLLMFIILLFQFLSQLPPTLVLEDLKNHPGFIQLMDVAMIVNFLQLLWAMFFCHRLNVCTQAKPGDRHYGSYFFLALSHLLIVNIFYLQYKLNQLIDENVQSQGENTIGLM
jgi:hypothetical protein